jgi:hypothetical protein
VTACACGFVPITVARPLRLLTEFLSPGCSGIFVSLFYNAFSIRPVILFCQWQDEKFLTAAII